MKYAFKMMAVVLALGVLSNNAYVEQNVVQQSSGSQTPELQGDKDRVLVQFN